MSDLVLLTLLVLICYRVAILVTWDNGPYRVFLMFRTWLGRQAGNGKTWHTLADLFHCPFCLGIWFAFALCWLTPNPLLWWLAIAGGQAALTFAVGPREFDDD